MTNSTLPLLLLLLVLETGTAASPDDELWIPEGSNTPILKNHPTERTKVCTHRSAEGLCYELWLNDRSDPNAHLPIPWSSREDFVTLLDKLDRMAEGGYCLLYEGQPGSDWQGQGEASSACGELQHNTEQSTCLVPANACSSPCQPNEQDTRTGTVRNAACCVVTSWTPDPATMPAGETFTSTNNCGEAVLAIGEQTPCVANWTPDPATIPAGETFTMTNNCGKAKQATGEQLPPTSLFSRCLYASDGCTWQPGEQVAGEYYSSSLYITPHPYPWGALTGPCSGVDRHRFYYVSNEPDSPKGSFGRRYIYAQMCQKHATRPPP